MQPLVTISIPIFKCEDFLEKCLKSVIAQTYKNIEVTLINDQTTDNSVQIAEDFIKKNNLNNWKIYHLEENSGLSVVRNKGIDTAQGKYLFFLDSDDTITPDCIEKMVNLIEKERVEMVVGSVEAIKLPEEEHSPIFPILEERKVIRGNEDVFYSFIKEKYPVSSWNKLINVEFLRKNNLYFVEGLFAQDSLHSFHMAFKLNSVAFLKDVTYYYYLHNNSVIHNRTKKHFDNWFTIGRYIDKELKREKGDRRNLILSYLSNFKTMTLQMNWKAQKNKELWEESYNNYKILSTLSIKDYFSSNFSKEVKKNEILNNLPTFLGFRVFRYRWG